jgi:hypothetical protein
MLLEELLENGEVAVWHGRRLNDEDVSIPDVFVYLHEGLTILKRDEVALDGSNTLTVGQGINGLDQAGSQAWRASGAEDDFQGPSIIHRKLLSFCMSVLPFTLRLRCRSRQTSPGIHTNFLVACP